MAIIGAVVARIKSDPLLFLGGVERLNQCFTDAGHVWRDRVLDPANTMALFVLQILHGNTAMTNLRLLAGFGFSAGSYCDARKRLPIDGITRVVAQLSCDAVKYSQPASTWLGRRVLMTDATTTSTPDESKLQQIWPQSNQQKHGCGFPLIKLLALLDLTTGMVLQMTLMALTVHEAGQLGGMHGALSAGDVLLGDRGFCSFSHLVLLTRVKVDAVFRIGAGQIIDFTPGRTAGGKSHKKKTDRRSKPTSRFVKRLGPEDQITEWARPQKKPQGISAQVFADLPPTLLVREIHYVITAGGMRSRQVTIATTLLDPLRYPKHEIARLYKLRWEIETNFRHLKTTMKMEYLKSHSRDGVIKELMVFTLVYNLIRAVMNQAAAAQQVVDANRISFIDAMRWLISVLAKGSTGPMPKLIINPVRIDRWHPRVNKRRKRNFPAMIRPRVAYSPPAADNAIQP